MDLYGNLTELSEFDGNRQIRLISYLDPGSAVGVTGQQQYVTICDVADDDVDRTMWLAAGGVAGLTLQSVLSPGGFLDVSPPSGGGEGVDTPPLSLRYPGNTIDPDNAGYIPLTYSVTFVDGCWFTLTYLVIDGAGADGAGDVLDCSESDTTPGNPILFWPPNGGDNQKWRAATLGPGFPNRAP